MGTEIIPRSSLSAIIATSVELHPGTSLALVLPRDGARGSEHARKVLSDVLAAMTGRATASIRIEVDARGKPRLAGGGVEFNISHARGYSMVALSLAGDIGCDIENRFTNEDVMGLGQSILHVSELQAMERLVPAERQIAFRRYWVRKEAVLKAAGSGFLRDPRHVITGLQDRNPQWAQDGGPLLVIHNQLISEGCFAAVASTDSTCRWHLLES